jgi:DNA invertase Pin-like site-specific DNA recombinase
MVRTVTKKEKTLMAMPTLKRVCAYARVSSGKDAMLHSLAAQVSYYSEYIQRHPEWQYAGVYADEALTGTKGSRPEFIRLVGDCKAGLIDIVITKSISRFARNTVDLLNAVRELKALGVDVYFEEQNIHTLSADGEFMLTILASYAQEESRSASENRKWRGRKNYAEGKDAGYMHVYGYAYIAGDLIIIPEEADVVRMIFSEYMLGMGLNAIARKLIRLGIPTKLGGRWSEQAVANMLANEKYIGDMLLQKGYIADHLSKCWRVNTGELPQYYVEGHHEPILSRETFAAVQAEIARRSAKVKAPTKMEASEFIGLVRCAKCGSNYRRKQSAPGTKYNKTIWTCYTFDRYGKDICAARSIPDDILKEKSAEALGLEVYDESELVTKVERIDVMDDRTLLFIMKDGIEKTLTWQHRSRRESWTTEMREAARQKSLAEVRNG